MWKRWSAPVSVRSLQKYSSDLAGWPKCCYRHSYAGENRLFRPPGLPCSVWNIPLLPLSRPSHCHTRTLAHLWPCSIASHPARSVRFGCSVILTVIEHRVENLEFALTVENMPSPRRLSSGELLKTAFPVFPTRPSSSMRLETWRFSCWCWKKGEHAEFGAPAAYPTQFPGQSWWSKRPHPTWRRRKQGGGDAVMKFGLYQCLANLFKMSPRMRDGICICIESRKGNAEV